MESLRRTFLSLIKNINTNFQRKLDVNWENRMNAIIGARGVGKTTFMLQHIKQAHKSLDNVLYASLDNLYFYEKGLEEVVDLFYNYGGRYLYLDEVHKYTSWSRILKNIYDNYPDLNIVFTSSSVIDIYKGDADLSRRAVKYTMNGLSFREYLMLVHNIKVSSYTLEEILFNHEKIFLDLPKDFTVLIAFKNYLINGYYPFTLEPEFLSKLQNAINTVIEVDLNKAEGLSHNKIEQIKKIMGVIAESAPFKPNISAISQKTGISRDIIHGAIYQLKRAKLLNLLHAKNKGISSLQKPNKLYLENSNLMYALKDNPDIGNIRETFLLNQLANNNHAVHASKEADFLIDGLYFFEVGGRNKDHSQIKLLKNAFLVKDDIEAGSKNVIPLWMFGLLY
ncbi:MAG: ATP-binding protein [Bacteroidota bacterium]